MIAMTVAIVILAFAVLLGLLCIMAFKQDPESLMVSGLFTLLTIAALVALSFPYGELLDHRAVTNIPAEAPLK